MALSRMRAAMLGMSESLQLQQHASVTNELQQKRGSTVTFDFFFVVEYIAFIERVMYLVCLLVRLVNSLRR